MGTINACLVFVPGASQNSGLTRYPDAGGLRTTESYAQFQTTKCTITFWGTYLITNTLNGTTTVNLRINGSTVDTITITAGTTGFQNKSANILVQDNDLVSMQIITGGTSGSIALRGGGIMYE